MIIVTTIIHCSCKTGDHIHFLCEISDHSRCSCEIGDHVSPTKVNSNRDCHDLNVFSKNMLYFIILGFYDTWSHIIVY